MQHKNKNKYFDLVFVIILTIFTSILLSPLLITQKTTRNKYGFVKIGTNDFYEIAWKHLDIPCQVTHKTRVLAQP